MTPLVSRTCFDGAANILLKSCGKKRTVNPGVKCNLYKSAALVDSKSSSEGTGRRSHFLFFDFFELRRDPELAELGRLIDNFFLSVSLLEEEFDEDIYPQQARTASQRQIISQIGISKNDKQK